MSRRSGRRSWSTPVATSTLFVALVLVLLATQSGRGQEPTNTLTFFKNYFLTGDVVAYGIALKGTGSGGFANGTIAIPPNAVPAGAEAVTAFLYWATAVPETALDSGMAGARFNNQDISEIGKRLSPEGTSPCWSAGGGSGGGQGDGAKRLVYYRADVLRFFPEDTAGNFIINGANVSVRLPDSGVGNVVPFTLGASVVVLFRVPGATVPFRAISIYDGGFTIDQGSDTLTQSLAGFYQASTTSPNAKLWTIVGDGQSNFSEQVSFTDDIRQANSQPDQTFAPNPFVNGWDTVPFDVALSPNAAAASVKIAPLTANFDCLTGGVFILSAVAQDGDGDGLLDIWETTSGLTDPNGEPLPNLPAMGAHPGRKDLFTEIASMYANPQTRYGPLSGDHVIDPAGHEHLPSRQVLERVAAAFRNAPQPIYAHFDVGAHLQAPAIDPSTNQPYAPLPSLAQCNANWTPACAIIPAVQDPADPTKLLARGGERILEKACVPNPPLVTCTFTDWPGLSGWKTGFHYFKNAFVQPSGDEWPSTAQEDQCELSGNCRRRFDANRKHIFHFGLIAHSTSQVNPATPGVPGKSSGQGDKPGGDWQMTIGAWGHAIGDFVGSEDVQAGTILHEMGHNGWLGHRGDLTTSLEGNCNPNYLSVMNYLFQTHLLRNVSGEAVIDLSRRPLGPLDETNLPLGFGTLDYRTSYYALRATVDAQLGTTAAKRHCDGSPLSPAEEQARLGGGGMVRVDGTGVFTPPPSGGNRVPIDWNGDLNVNNDAGLSQDVSFNGENPNSEIAPLNTLHGADDWAILTAFGLRQVSGRRSIEGLSVDVGKADGGKADGGKADGGKADGGKADGGKADGGDEQDLETATAVGHPPHSLKAVQAKVGKTTVVNLTWKRPSVGGVTGVDKYQIYRVDGTTLTDANFAKRTFLGESEGTQFTDPKVVTGKAYTYFVVAVFNPVGVEAGTFSGKSNLATITIGK